MRASDVERFIKEEMNKPKLMEGVKGLPLWLQLAINYAGQQFGDEAIVLTLSTYEKVGIPRHQIHLGVESWVEKNPDDQ